MRDPYRNPYEQRAIDVERGELVERLRYEGAQRWIHRNGVFWSPGLLLARADQVGQERAAAEAIEHRNARRAEEAEKATATRGALPAKSRDARVSSAASKRAVANADDKTEEPDGAKAEDPRATGGKWANRGLSRPRLPH